MKREQRAQQVWQVLTSAARNRQILTYELLAKAIGMGAGTLAGPLGCVMYYCQQRGLPPLTVLVVGKAGGRPGIGLITSKNVNIDRERVYAHNWFESVPPTETELAHALAVGEAEA